MHMTGRNDAPPEFVSDEEMMAELDRAMGEYVAMERRLAEQMPLPEASQRATEKMMDHFMGMLFK
jgi:hypothetical protein